MPSPTPDVLILSSVCGKHFDENCPACQSAKASNDQRLSRASLEDEVRAENKHPMICPECESELLHYCTICQRYQPVSKHREPER